MSGETVSVASRARFAEHDLCVLFGFGWSFPFVLVPFFDGIFTAGRVTGTRLASALIEE